MTRRETGGELLTRATSARPTAFEVRCDDTRPMVYGVCRHLLRSEADAEDAFQATFLVLIVARAASIRSREKAASTGCTASPTTRPRKGEMRAMKRRAKEREAGESHRPEAAEDIWGPTLPLLYQEIHRLPEHYRLAVVLCDLEGKSHKDAAAQLGWPQGTLSGRLSRARALLRRRPGAHAALRPRQQGALVAGVLGRPPCRWG